MTPTQRPPLKVGDRVKVYGVDSTDGTVVTDKGTVVSVMVDGAVCVACDAWNRNWFHPRQLSRIKPPRKRREWWVCQDKDGNVMTFGGKTLHQEKGCVQVGWHWIKVREVLKPRREREE